MPEACPARLLQPECLHPAQEENQQGQESRQRQLLFKN